MIEAAYGTYTPICDGCGEELAAEYDFYDAVAAMKSEGWRLEPPSQTGGDWLHLCPECAGRCDFE